MKIDFIYQSVINHRDYCKYIEKWRTSCEIANSMPMLSQHYNYTLASGGARG